MTTFVSMLRGVNVAGHKRLKMSELAGTYASLGLDNVRTYVQSGNVVFSCDSADESSLAQRIERQLKLRLGLDVTIFIRTTNELGRLVARNPFAGKDESRLHVTFLHTRPGRIPTDKLDSARGIGEEFAMSDRGVYLFLPGGYVGRSCRTVSLKSC